MLTLRQTRVVLSTAALMACAVGLASCESFFAPCDSIPAKGGQTKFMDGEWPLKTVSGATFNGNHRLLDGSVLHKASLSFHTYYLEEGSCSDPKESSGDVVALYEVTNNKGVRLPQRTQIGRFTYVNASRVLTLSALGKSANGTSTLFASGAGGGADNSTVAVNVVIPVEALGIALPSIKYDLVFRRQ